MKHPLATIAVLGLLGAMTASADASNSNVESALASQGDLSMFHQALLNTGVASELKENTKYTVFAPTNAAFAEIQPRTYPCFYSAQCRAEVAAVLRNHIVPHNESIADLSKWGGDIPTLGSRRLDVEEAYKNDYVVDGHKVLNRSDDDSVRLYRIDGVIVDDKELNRFRTQPVAEIPGTVTQKTVTTYRASGVSPVVYEGSAPGGSPTSALVYESPAESGSAVETTTVVHTTRNQ